MTPLLSMDVLDVAWAPDDSLLASCSVDNAVLVWRLDHCLPSSGTQAVASGGGPGGGAVGVVVSPWQRLVGHGPWVKGLAWDPMGSYLASAAEDRTLIVWRSSDWQVKGAG